LLKGLPINLNLTGAGCTVLIAPNDNGEFIFGRNFDFSYCQSLSGVIFANCNTDNLIGFEIKP